MASSISLSAEGRDEDVAQRGEMKENAGGSGKRGLGTKRRRISVPGSAELRKARVLVVGDVMLDRYLFGEVSRISPEAPVPVVRVVREEERPGGAANVARNAAALGARVTLLSVIGNDEPGRRLRKLIKREGIIDNLWPDRSLQTTRKVRVIGRQQQLLRIDFEQTPSDEALKKKVGIYRNLLVKSDVVILSDYGKGGLAHIGEMIKLARTYGKRIFVDPKGHDYSRYRGANVVTPNRSELREVVGPWSGEAELRKKAQRLRSELGLDALLVTRSEEGMTLYDEAGRHNEATKAREVFDVSGAGDTVIAALAVMMAAGARMREAVRIANHAAGIVVGKLGTAVATREELIRSMKSE
jgi:D-glycero-beta-D-manno-heptose-7-phosphate kinase